MTQTLEQELDAFVANTDYRVRIAVTSYLHVTVLYVPARILVDQGGRIPLVLNDGEIGCKLFAGPPRWRWWRARRFVRKTIAGHRAMLVEGVVTW